MALTVFPVGQQDVTTYWIAYNNTTGARRTDITHSTAGLTLAFTRIREADVTAVVGGSPAPVSLAADNSAHADWGVRHVGGGKLRIDWPDAAFVTGVDSVVLDVYGPADTVFVPAGGLVDLPLSNPRAAGLTAAAVATAVNDDAIDRFDGFTSGETTLSISSVVFTIIRNVKGYITSMTRNP